MGNIGNPDANGVDELADDDAAVWHLLLDSTGRRIHPKQRAMCQD